MGTVFDVYRVAARRFRIARWMLPPLDLIYWAAATLCVFAVLLRYNHGEVRLFVFLGLGIGVTGYFGLFSGWVVKLSGWLFEAIKRVSLLLWRIVRVLFVIPVSWLVRFLAKLIDIVFIILAALLLGLYRLAVKLLRPPGRWLWAKLMPIRRRMRPIVLAWRRGKEKWRQIRELFQKKE